MRQVALEDMIIMGPNAPVRLFTFRDGRIVGWTAVRALDNSLLYDWPRRGSKVLANDEIVEVISKDDT